MRVRIDSAKCVGHARCWAAAPEVFGLDEDTGYAFVLSETPAADLEDKARLGAGNCPERAIELIDD